MNGTGTNKGLLFLHSNPLGAGVRVTSTTFTNVEGSHVTGYESQGAAYVPATVTVYTTISRYPVLAAPMGMFASFTDAALQSIKQDAASPPTLDPPPPPSPPPPSPPPGPITPRSALPSPPLEPVSPAPLPAAAPLEPVSSPSPVGLAPATMGAIAGVAGSLVIVLVVAAVAALVVVRRRRRTHNHSQQMAAPNKPPFDPYSGSMRPVQAAHHSHVSSGPYHSHGPSYSNMSIQSSQHDVAFQTHLPPTLAASSTFNASSLHSGGYQGQPSYQHPGSAHASASSNSAVPFPIPIVVPTDTSERTTDTSPRTSIVATLDRLHHEQRLLYGEYMIMGTGITHRRHGGQAVVQFIEDKQTREQLAAKFFTRRVDYLREWQLYSIHALRAAMPGLIAAKEPGWRPPEWGNGAGAALPPCLIMERGESLQEYVRAAGHNLFSTVQALGHVLQKLEDLHRAGWVHRDLKPSNTLWNPSKRSWALLDFGCAAQAGRPATIAYTLVYAAPEVLCAREEGNTEVFVQPAIDMWSFGVIAFEMLTEQPIFPKFTMENEVVNVAMGRAPYPWEDQQKGPPLLKKLGMFKKSLLLCLTRDPGQRVTGPQLIDMWGQLFSAQTMTTKM